MTNKRENNQFRIRRGDPARQGSSPGAPPNRNGPLEDRTARVTVRVSADIHRVLAIAAAYEGRNVSDMCADMIIPEALKLQEKHNIQL